MTRSELITALAIKKKLPSVVAERIVTEIFDGMSETLISGGRIEIRGFGSLENRQYGSRNGRNPQTGTQVAVKPKKCPFFKAGKGIKEQIQAD